MSSDSVLPVPSGKSYFGFNRDAIAAAFWREGEGGMGLGAFCEEELSCIFPTRGFNHLNLNLSS